MPDFAIVCPGCQKPLKVPAAAVGGAAHCPRCKANFKLPANPDGSPGEPVPTRRPAIVLPMPGALVFPAFALITLGLIGTLVNAYMSFQFTFREGSDREHARVLIAEQRAQESLYKIGDRKDEWEAAPQAALGGVAAAQVAQDEQDERVAATWAEGMIPLHYGSTAVSLLTLFGGLSILRGRFYPIALLGCFAAAININHFCCAPGLVAGAWGFLALIREDVKPHFRRP